MTGMLDPKPQLQVPCAGRITSVPLQYFSLLQINHFSFNEISGVFKMWVGFSKLQPVRTVGIAKQFRV